MDPYPLAKALIKQHEGFSHHVYQCTSGKNTIGYGRNLDDVGISKVEATLLLEHDIHACLIDLRELSFWRALSPVRQAVLIDMRYNLGLPRFTGFKRMLAALDDRLYALAADEMLDSNWAKQVARRANRLALMMVTGVRHKHGTTRRY